MSLVDVFTLHELPVPLASEVAIGGGHAEVLVLTCSCTGGLYHSSTSLASAPASAWNMQFSTGLENPDSMNSFGQVRGVRAARDLVFDSEWGKASRSSFFPLT
jgi:hypothetical protein